MHQYNEVLGLSLEAPDAVLRRFHGLDTGCYGFVRASHAPDDGG
jgi:hypothetical protein